LGMLFHSRHPWAQGGSVAGRWPPPCRPRPMIGCCRHPAPRPGSVGVEAEVPVEVEVVLLVEHLLVVVARAYPSSDSIIRIRRSARFLICRTRSGVTPSLPAISPRASGPSPPTP